MAGEPQASSKLPCLPFPQVAAVRLSPRMRGLAGWLISSAGWLLVWVFGLVGFYVLLGSTHYTNGAAGPILNVVAIPLGASLVFVGRAIRGRGRLWLALRRRARRKQGLDW